MSFVDIAGIVQGASEGEGLGNKFLANIREADAICQVVAGLRRRRTSSTSTARSTPRDDIETINTELILADLQTLEKAVPRLEKEARSNKDRAAVARRPREAAQALLDGRHDRSSPPADRPRRRCASCRC